MIGLSLLGLLGMSVGKLVGIVALGVAAGILISKIVLLTLSLLTNKIKQKLAKRNISKVAVCELSTLVNNCSNEATLAELEALQNKGVTHFTAEVQEDGQIEQTGIDVMNVEKEDSDVYDFINRTGEGTVVISV